MRPLACILALSLAPASVQAEADLTVRPGHFAMIEAGILCVGGTRSRMAAPDTRLGYVNQLKGEVVLGQAARRIPARMGLSFGVVMTAADNAMSAEVTIIVTYPPMGPEGRTRGTWPSAILPGSSTAKFYTFEFAEELVPGTWTMQAVAGDDLLYTARFEVVPESAMPGFADPCDGPPPTS